MTYIAQFLIKRGLVFFWTIQLKIELLVTVIVMCLFYLFDENESPLAYNILVGLLSSILLVMILTIVQQAKNFYNYSYLYGEFLRVRFYERKISPENPEKSYKMQETYYSSINDRYIDFLYNGSGSFTGVVEFSEGKIRFELSIDPQVPSIGKGSSHYITKRHITGSNDTALLFSHSSRAIQDLDFGMLSSIKYTLNINYVILVHDNISPSGNAAGYEVLISKYDYFQSLARVKKAITKSIKLKVRLSNSHDYTAIDQYMLVHPYFLADEIATRDPVICGFAEKTLTNYTGPILISIPFASTIELTDEKFESQNVIFDWGKYIKWYPEKGP